MIFNLTGGSASGGATLTVTGNSGDYIELTDGSTVKTGTIGSNGSVLFRGMTAGTWTMNAKHSASGSTFYTTTITVTTAYSVSVVYFDGHLYDASKGDLDLNECISATGGWERFKPSKYNEGTVTKATDGITITVFVPGYQDNGCDESVRTVNKIDLTGKTAIKVKAVDVSANNPLIVGIETRETTPTNYSLDYITHTVTVDSTDEKTIDISSVTGEYHIIAYKHLTANGTQTSQITRKSKLVSVTLE